jgi:hypothetical protein
MRGLRSTLALLAVLAGLGAYIYFVTWKIEPDDPTKVEKVFDGLNADAIVGLQITSDKGPMTTLEKADNAWRITAPEAAATDQSEASSVATGLAAVELGRVIEENAATLADYGLDPPRIDVAFKTTTDTNYRHLLIGDKTATGGDLFAKLDNSNRVFLIPAYQESTFNKGPFDLRDKTLLAFERDKLLSIEVINGGSSFTLAKAAGSTDWAVTKPVQYRADPSAVEGLRARLETAQMKSIVKPEATAEDLKTFGFNNPTSKVVLDYGGRTTLEFGATTEDGDIYARESSRPNFVSTVDPAMVEDVTKAAFEYRRKDIFDFRPFSATRIEFIRADGSALPFEKVKGEAKDGKEAVDIWRRLGPNPVDAPQEAMSTLLSALSTMRALSFVDSTANTGLDKPELTVVATFGEDRREERVSFGRVENDVHAARPNEPGAARVSDDEYAAAQKALLEVAK